MSYDPDRLCPTVTGYRYVTDAGLLRVPMSDGVIRQRRMWLNARTVLDVRFILTLDELAAAEAFLYEVGADWWTMNLVTGQAGGMPTLHTVRLLADPQVRALANAPRFELLLSVETQGETGGDDGGSSSSS